MLCDNATIHRYEPFKLILALYGVRIIYIPTYLPHLNPIEMFFNILKARFMRHRHLMHHHPVETLVAILEKYRNYNAMGAIKKSGYLKFCNF